MSQRSKHTLDISDGAFLDTKTATGYRDTRRSYSRSLVRHSIHSISWKWPLIALVASAIVLIVVHEIDYIMPTVVTESEAINNPSLFSGERSRNTLVKLTEMGPRVVGSHENRVLAPGVITDEIKRAQKSAHSSQFLQYEVQRGSGAYNLEYKPRFTNVYHGIQNVIAVLEGSNKKHGILLNCHYDSVPTSDGASDDALICAIMIELIRVLSQSNVRLKHSLIFLFNGAEESGLHASHLFLKHKWFTPARIFLNMEAAGVGGRPIIFQSGPQNSWLIYYYATHAPHPHGHVMGEELFQSGALPSDTDFRIFRDFGKLPGLDIAFIRNGYLYHTKYDKEMYIAPGCHQNLGENILSYLRVIGNAPEIENMKENKEGHAVYFDFLGWFMIRYSLEQGTIINLGVFLLSMLSVGVFIVRINQGFALKELAIALGGLLVGMFAGLFATVTMGFFIGMVAPLAMPWYSNVWLLFPLFWCPLLLECGIVLIWVDSWREKKRGLSVSMATQLNLVAAQIPWAVLLLLLTIFGVRSTAVPMITVLFAALANLAIHLTPLYRTVHKWVWVYLAVHIPCMVYQLYVMKMCYMLFIPSMGRSGAINGDVVIAVITWVLAVYCTSFAVPLFSLVRRPGIVLGVLLGFCLLMIPISFYTSVGQPYKAGPDSPAPQRYWIMHSERSFYNESNMLRRHETGYFVLNLDRNSPRTIPQADGRSISPLANDCNEELYCGLPLYLSRMIPLSRTSSWIPASAPSLPSPTAFTTKERTCTPNPPKCTVKLLVKGPDRVTLTFAPREGVTLAGWDLPTVPLSSGEWKGRPSYFINVVSEGITEDYALTLHFNVTSNLTAPILDIGLAGNFVHHEKERTQEFREFLNEFPEWTQITGWISSYSAYVI